MNDQEPEASAPKRPKLSLEDESDENQLPIAGPSNEQSPPKIFKLDIDCMDEIFEYLSLKDLDSFAQTCKAMHKVAGEYFKQNYTSTCLEMKDYKPSMFVFLGGDLPSAGIFDPMVKEIYLTGYNSERPLLYIALNPDEFGATNSIIFKNIVVNEQMIKTLNGIFPKLESVYIDEVDVDVKVNLYKAMLKKCTNLKCLTMWNSSVRTTLWMHQKYPKLEHFGLLPVRSIEGLKIFLQNNPNLQSFLVYAEDIWVHRHEIMHFRMQFDSLKVVIYMRHISSAPFCKLLNQLYEQKFYRRLHLEIHIQSGDQITTDDSFYAGLASFDGLETLDIEYVRYLLCLPDLRDLKELRVTRGIESSELKLIPKKFANLQRLYIQTATDEHILSIIQGLPKLKVLAFDNSQYKHIRQNILKLRTLNTERKKMFEAQKVTIYVSDEVFLRTKWSIANGDTNLKMIEMKRLASLSHDQSNIFQ